MSLYPKIEVRTLQTTKSCSRWCFTTLTVPLPPSHSPPWELRYNLWLSINLQTRSSTTDSMNTLTISSVQSKFSIFSTWWGIRRLAWLSILWMGRLVLQNGSIHPSLLPWKNRFFLRALKNSIFKKTRSGSCSIVLSVLSTRLVVSPFLYLLVTKWIDMDQSSFQRSLY